jgi:hypothetical protein
MIETLRFEVSNVYQNGQPLSNASCTIILGSQSTDVSIPTREAVVIKTGDLNESESLLVLINHNDDVVAKISQPLASLRFNTDLSTQLETIDNGNPEAVNNVYTWEHIYSLVREDSSKLQSGNNPFKGNLLRSPDAKNATPGYDAIKDPHESPAMKLNLSKHSDAGLASFDAGAKGFSPTKPPQESPTKVKVDFYLSSMEAKLKNSAQNAPEVAQLINNIRSTVQELERSKFGEVTSPAQLSGGQGQLNNSSENYSPKFGKFLHASQRSDDSLGQRSYDHNKDYIDEVKTNLNQPNYVSLLRDVNHAEQPNEEEKSHDEEDVARDQVDDGVLEADAEDEDEDEAEILNQMGDHGHLEGERPEDNSFPKSVDTDGSIQEDIKIDRNQEFLLEIKSQLAVKTLSHVTDPFTRELVMQMSRSKKKVCVVRLKKSIKLRPKDEVPIETKSYFRDGCEKKLMHYFQPYTKYLFMFNLAKPFDVIQEKSQIVTLDIDFDISPHAKSVITPSGLIFIASGRAEPTASDLDDSSGSLHVYNSNGQTLLEKASMTASRRKNFGMCYMSKNIFIIGGIVNGILSNYCERYDIRSNEWLEIAPMNKKLKDISVCAFNNRYVYRFFGVNAHGMIDNSIERYDAVRDKWVVMNVAIPDLLRDIHLPLSTQIAEDTIFLFGGRTGSGFPSRSNKGFAVKIEDKRRSTTAEIIQTKNFVSGLAGNFSQNHIIAHSGDILFVRESY